MLQKILGPTSSSQSSTYLFRRVSYATRYLFTYWDSYERFTPWNLFFTTYSVLLQQENDPYVKQERCSKTINI